MTEIEVLREELANKAHELEVLKSAIFDPGVGVGATKGYKRTLPSPGEM